MTLRFLCNVCGSRQISVTGRFQREGGSCLACGSSMRNRAVVEALSRVLWDASLPLPEFPEHKDCRGIGLSDWEGFALRLSDRLDYENTFYHQHPKVDICEPPADMLGTLDFVTSSNVFEHTLPPASRAFTGAFSVLKPGGWLVLTVPYFRGRETLEKYPRLATYETVKVGDHWALVNLLPDGTLELHPDPVFHGGPGSTVEVRQFGEDDLLRELADAGFEAVRVCSESNPEFGIVWEYQDHLPIVARRPFAF